MVKWNLKAALLGADEVKLGSIDCHPVSRDQVEGWYKHWQTIENLCSTKENVASSMRESGAVFLGGIGKMKVDALAFVHDDKMVVTGAVVLAKKGAFLLEVLREERNKDLEVYIIMRKSKAERMYWDFELKKGEEIKYLEKLRKI